MAVSKKAKAKEVQSTTLHSFFQRPDNKRKAKSKVDVIVIDSDSDPDSSPPPQSKRVKKEAVPLVTDSGLFGKPTSLLPAGPPTPPTRPPLPTTTSSSSVEIPVVDLEPLPADEDWNMGDDEQINMDDEDDEVEIISTSEDCPTCPICETRLQDLNEQAIEAHVNKCLESPPKQPSETHTDRPGPSSPKKPLRPLSSLNKGICLSELAASAATTDVKPGSNAFSILMSSHKENEAWKEATIAEDRSCRPSKSNRRKAPFYKVMQGMPIAVDAFKYGSIPGITAYFLTHAHSDHYTNLSSTWKSGPIYCSEGTANLIIHMLSVDPKWVHPIPNDVPTVIPNTNGVTVTVIEANHCPGSSLFLFEGIQTVDAGDSTFKSPFIGSQRVFRYLHCGDFRASPRHVLHPAMKGKKIDACYLDTTYLDPKYTFPPQPQVISACAELAKRIVSGEVAEQGGAGAMDAWASKQPGTAAATTPKKKSNHLIVVGTYSIGKERIVRAIAEALGSKVYCDARKMAILKCQNDPELHALLTTDPLEASVHLLPLGMITSDKLQPYVDKFKGAFTKAVGFRPTGWSYTPPVGSEQTPAVASIISRSATRRTFTYANLRPARNSTNSLQLYGVPYSEHSSFFELTCFAMSFDWGRMIATVNVGSESSRGKMGKWVERWEAERKRRGKEEVVQYRELDYW